MQASQFPATDPPIQRAQSSNTFAHRLPPELWAHIFVLELLSCASTNRDVLKYQIVVSSICSYLRTIALSTPKLWSIIRLCFDDSGSDEIIELISTRSSAAPLRLHIMQCVPDSRITERQVALVASLMVHTVDYRVGFRKDALLFSTNLDSERMPRLQSLSMYHIWTHGESDVPDEFLPVFPRLHPPALECLELDISGMPPLEVTSLPRTIRTFKFGSIMDLSDDSSIDVLALVGIQCPDLQVLQIENWVGVEVRSLPARLHTLNIGKLVDPQSPFPFRDCSALMHLQMNVQPRRVTLARPVHLTSALHNLRTLSLDMLPDGTQAHAAMDFLSFTPNLRALDVSWTCLRHLSALISPDSSIPLTQSASGSRARPTEAFRGLPPMHRLRLLRITVSELEFFRDIQPVQFHAAAGDEREEQDDVAPVPNTGSSRDASDGNLAFPEFLSLMQTLMDHQADVQVDQRLTIEWWVEPAHLLLRSFSGDRQARRRAYVRINRSLALWAPPSNASWFYDGSKIEWRTRVTNLIPYNCAREEDELRDVLGMVAKHFVDKTPLSSLGWTEAL